MLFDVYRDLKDLYHANHFDKLDWITKNRLQMKKIRPEVKKVIKDNASKSQRKKIMFWSTSAWERGAMEHMVAYSLKLRGHEIEGVTCEGRFPTCSMVSTKSERPDCTYCHGRNRKLLDIFDLNPHYHSTSEYITAEDIEKYTSLVNCLSREDFSSITFKGIKIGQLVDRDLPQYYFKLVSIDDPEIEDFVRESLVSTIVYAHCAFAALEEIQPGLAMVTSGKTVAFSPFYEACLLKGIPVVTWDESGYDMEGFILKFNNFANEYHLDEIWEKVKHLPLNKSENQLVDAYLKNTVKGNVGTAVLYKNPVYDRNKIRSELDLQPDKKVVVLLSNITWDTSTLGKDIIFSSMFEWICKTIDFYKDKPDFQLIIRCHPSEGDMPVFIRSDEKVSDLIFDKYGENLENIKVVTGKSNLNSHELSEISDLILVYTTFVGLEMAERGRKVVVCGSGHYRGKGFTADVNTIEEYFDILSNPDTFKNKNITAEKVELARRYLYCFLNRVHVYLPEFRAENRHSFYIKNPEDFLPGGSRRWDKICEEMVNLGDFMDCAPVDEIKFNDLLKGI